MQLSMSGARPVATAATMAAPAAPASSRVELRMRVPSAAPRMARSALERAAPPVMRTSDGIAPMAA